MANDIKLQEGHPVDENLRPIKVGGKSTAIETAQYGNGARVTGDLEVTGNISSANFATGDITGVDLTGGTGISIASETGTTSGNYSSTINCDLEGTELISTGETSASKFLREDGDGSCSWQTGAGISTTLSAGNILVGDGSNVAASVNPSGDVDVNFAGVFSIASGAIVDGDVNASAAIAYSKLGTIPTFNQDTSGTAATVTDAAQPAIESLGTLTSLIVDNIAINGATITMTGSPLDTFTATVATDGVTTLATTDAAGADAHLNIEADGHVEFDGCAVGFDRLEAVFADSDVIGGSGTNTDIDFRLSNKYRLELTADILTNVNLIFPNTSGNFLLVCTTDGDHDVSNWKVYKSDESAATTTDVMWAGGSVPAFTTSGIDIVSFYWDAEEQQAYGVASLAFATP